MSLPNNYQKANSLYLMSKGYTQVPSELRNCTKLRSLNLRDNPLEELPIWLKELPLLSTLIIGHENGVPIPNWLGEMQQLEELFISYNEMFEVPACIAQLKNLKVLNLRHNHLNEIPPFIFELPQLQELSLGNNKITQIPKQLGQLTTLKKLAIQNNPITHRLPESIAQLKQLQQIYWKGIPIQQLPTSTLFLPQLNVYVFLDDNRSEEIEKLLKRFQKLKPIISPEEMTELMPYVEFSNGTLQGRHPKATHPIILNKTFSNFFHRAAKQNISKTDRKKLFQIIIRHKDIQDLSRQELYRLYDIDIPASQQAIINQLPQSSPTFAEKGFQEDSLLALKGKFLETEILSSKLEDSAIKYEIDQISTTTTHVLIATEGVDLTPEECRADLVFINQSQLQSYWNELETPYLLDTSEASPEQVAQIRELIVNKEESNILLGLQMLEGLGLPESLLPYVFCTFKTTDKKEIQQIAKQLLLHFGTEKIRANLNNKLLLVSRAGAGDVADGRVQYWAEITDLDAFDIYYFLYKKDLLTVDYLFNYEGGDESILRKALLHLVKGNELVIENFTHLKKLPDFVYELKEITGLKLRRSQMTSLPEGISQWQQLQSISLTFNSKLFALPSDFTQLQNLQNLLIEEAAIHELPTDLGKLSKLKKVILSFCFQLQTLPDSIYQLPQLEILHLKNTGINHPLTQIHQLQTLKELELKDFRFDFLPFEKIYQLKNLRKLLISDIYKIRDEISKFIPDGIAQLTQLESLHFLNSPINQLPTDLGHLPHLSKLHILNCHNLQALPTSLGQLHQLKELHLFTERIKTFPTQIYQLKKLEILNINFNNWREFPDGISNLENLKTLKLRDAKIIELPGDLGLLSSLEELDITHCDDLRKIPTNMHLLQNLRLIKARRVSQKIIHRLTKKLPNCQISMHY